MRLHITEDQFIEALYPYFIHPLHAVIKRNIAYTQNYAKKCFAILKKHFHLWQGKSLVMLGIFIAN